MKYLVDVERLKKMYLNKLFFTKTISGDEDHYISLGNVIYEFEENIELKEIIIGNARKKAFVLTTEGFKEFFPIVVFRYAKRSDYHFGIRSLNSIMNHIEGYKWLEKMRSENKIAEHPEDLLNVWFFICGGNICIEKPENVTYLNENNFVIEPLIVNGIIENPEVNISSDENWWIINIKNPTEFAFLDISVGNSKYRFEFLYPYCHKIKIRRGSCIFFAKDEKIYCT